ncbi:hypothetical protein CRM22_010786 [Opisthorchis felineus]|uniref:Uncharacterized protein n=1 Tax=Opisthorchis felineus TaxID=147828 RepID=A0A4S2KM74_OPIFE|nr:hypothetical protein CRM22_010786 [Opisthorchis felineus]
MILNSRYFCICKITDDCACKRSSNVQRSYTRLELNSYSVVECTVDHRVHLDNITETICLLPSSFDGQLQYYLNNPSASGSVIRPSTAITLLGYSSIHATTDYHGRPNLLAFSRTR